MKRALALVALLQLAFCGNSPVAYDDAYLNDTLSVARLGKGRSETPQIWTKFPR